MKKNLIEESLGLGFGMALLLAGCATTHYKVTDPHSGNTYYTDKVENLSGGTVKLKDVRTGSDVTIQNSEVMEISEEAYKEGLAAPVSRPAATTTAPTRGV